MNRQIAISKDELLQKMYDILQYSHSFDYIKRELIEWEVIPPRVGTYCETSREGMAWSCQPEIDKALQEALGDIQEVIIIG